MRGSTFARPTIRLQSDETSEKFIGEGPRSEGTANNLVIETRQVQTFGVTPSWTTVLMSPSVFAQLQAGGQEGSLTR